MNKLKKIEIKEYLFHPEVFLPSIIQKKVEMEIKGIKKIIFTEHSKSSLEDELCISSLTPEDYLNIQNHIRKGINNTINKYIFEIGIKVSEGKFALSKVCFREKFKKSSGNEVDICVVVSLEKEEDKYRIKTFWLNDVNDKHKTLKKGKYIKNEIELVNILSN